MMSIDNYLSKTEQIAVLNKYNINDNAIHEQKVTCFALKLFDFIAERYQLQEEDRILLHYSALLHDIGCFISKKNHHKHTKYLILREPMLDKIPKDFRKLIAFIAYGHRKSIDNNIKFYPPNVQCKILQLIALLRVADALDHTHKFEISLDKIELKNEALKLLIRGENSYKILPKFEKKSLLFTEVFNMSISINY